MIMYKLLPLFPVISNIQMIKRLSDGSTIPSDPANTDYQAYLKWVAEGNEPLPAENK